METVPKGIREASTVGKHIAGAYRSRRGILGRHDAANSVGAICQKVWHWDADDCEPEHSVGRSYAPASNPGGICATSILSRCASDTIVASVAEQKALGQPKVLGEKRVIRVYAGKNRGLQSANRQW